MRVLLVDDNGGGFELIKKRLEKYAPGIEFVKALSFDDALQKAGGGFCCILSAVELSGGSGLELLMHVRRAEHGTPVVLIAKEEEVKLAKKAFDLGAADFLISDLSETDALRIASLIKQGNRRSPGPARHPEAERDRNRLEWASRVNAALAELSQAVIRPASVESISALILQYALQLTGSEIGFVGYIDPETGHIVSPTLTQDFWDKCNVKRKRNIFKKFGGLWGWVLKNKKSLLTNSAADDPRSGGIPNGHAQIDRFLSVPVILGEKLLGQIALANSKRDYNQGDLKAVERMAAVYAFAITRQRAEEAIRTSEERYRTLVETVEDGIGMVDPDENFIFANRAAAHIFGLADGELAGKNLSEFCTQSEMEKLRRETKLRCRGTTSRYEAEIRRKDGHRRVLSITASPVFETGGVFRGTFGVFQDITERKLQEEELTTSRDRLAEQAKLLAAANKELESFAYTVSHDLRAPLRRIRSFAGLLIDAYTDKLDDSGRHYLHSMEKNCRKMQQLIDSLLHFSMSIQSEICYREIDLSEMARKLAGEMRRDKPEREVHFAITGSIKAKGDPGLLRIALENLLGNALKFTAGVQNARIEFGAREDHGRVIYYVADNGIGFEQAEAHRLFAAFERLHEGDFEGSGIGLATVQRIISRHGGEIWAEGKPGQGAVFYFTLNKPRAHRDSRKGN